MERLRDDLRSAFRGFRRTPTFVIAVLAILGLGIGTAIAMLTTFQAVLVRQLPVQDQDRILVLSTHRVPTVELSPPAKDLPEIRRASHTMRDVAGVAHWGSASEPFLDGERTLVLQHAPVTSNYFDVLGARPTLGRFLRPEDEAAGAASVMVLSHGVWRSRFSSSTSVIGRQVVDPYARRAYTIVGVAPAGLDSPVGADCWTPIVQGATTRV